MIDCWIRDNRIVDKKAAYGYKSTVIEDYETARKIVQGKK
jgi:hypothetical protein